MLLLFCVVMLLLFYLASRLIKQTTPKNIGKKVVFVSRNSPFKRKTSKKEKKKKKEKKIRIRIKNMNMNSHIHIFDSYLIIRIITSI